MTWPLANVGYKAGSLSITPNVYSMNELAGIQLPFGYLAIEFSIFFPDPRKEKYRRGSDR
jgi:hypothetical protein